MLTNLNNKYCLLIKSGDAELRALDNLFNGKQHIFPIIELTRGRKSKIDRIGKLSKRIERIEDIFSGCDVCLDLTTSEDLSNEEISSLFKSDKGYKNWTDFLIEQKNKNIYKSITPTIVLDSQDPNIGPNLSKQIQTLYNNFDVVSYRNNLGDDGCYDDLAIIKSTLSIRTFKNFIFILDCEYVTQGSWRNFADKIKTRIKKVSSILPGCNIILLSTSFPRYVSDIGGEDYDTFKLSEIDLYNLVSKSIGKDEIIYGDYGTINPDRNDLIKMSRGWRPRIDVPLTTEVFYYRGKKSESEEYSDIYIDLAKYFVTKDKRFPFSLIKNWGIQQILLCSQGSSPGSNPSFWISVRMNIHIEQQLRRLKYF